MMGESERARKVVDNSGWLMTESKPKAEDASGAERLQRALAPPDTQSRIHRRYRYRSGLLDQRASRTNVGGREKENVVSMCYATDGMGAKGRPDGLVESAEAH